MKNIFEVIKLLKESIVLNCFNSSNIKTKTIKDLIIIRNSNFNYSENLIKAINIINSFSENELQVFNFIRMNTYLYSEKYDVSINDIIKYMIKFINIYNIARMPQLKIFDKRVNKIIHEYTHLGIRINLVNDDDKCIEFFTVDTEEEFNKILLAVTGIQKLNRDYLKYEDFSDTILDSIRLYKYLK